MAIEFQILGKPTRDNVVYLKVDSGQSISRFLFDCGYGCLDEVPISELQSVDAVCISHFHMDHVSGFDSLLRFNFSRDESHPFLVVGPQDTCRAIHHKLQGFTWNLVDDSTGVVEVCEFANQKRIRHLYETKNRFVAPDSETTVEWNDRLVFQNKDCQISMIELNHGCVSGGYLVRESSRTNIDSEKMRELGLSPGPWLKQLKDGSDLESEVELNDRKFNLRELREMLLVTSKGNSFAYLTDFRVEDEHREELVDFIEGVDVLVCENSYTTEDADLAEKNFHMTTAEVAKLARDAKAGELVLFHLSSRYTSEVFPGLIGEARSIFENTRWPQGWFVE